MAGLSERRYNAGMNANLFDSLAYPRERFSEEALHAGWLSAISRGDQVAFRALYDATVSRVYHLALRITGHPQAAEDVVPEVYLQVWRDAASFDALRGKPLTWMLVICRSRALDYLRSHDPVELRSEPDELTADARVADVADLLLALERDSAVRGALAGLAPVQRQLIALAFFRGLSHQEIAAASRMPLGTVKSHIRKALDAMKKPLAEIHG